MKKEFTPKVSIVIPVYNGSNYLREAIDSALAQTYKNIEVVVVNDGSTDDGKTDEICRSYGKKIRYFLKENGGAATALNMGIEKMEGEYFSWLSHDDVYYPEKVESQVSVLSKLKDKETLVFSGYEIIDVDGNVLSKVDFLQKYKKKDLEKPLFAFFHMALNGCTMLIHKNYFKKYGTFNPALPTTQDYDLWFRVFRNSPICFDPNILFKSRTHGEQDSRNYIETHVAECNVFWMNVLQQITEIEMVNISGSKYQFFYDLYLSFSSLTLYNDFIDYLFVKSFNTLIELYKKSQTQKERIILLEDFVKLVGSERPLLASSIKRYLEYKKKKRKRVLFFTGAWFDRGGLNKMIASVSSAISSDYDVIVCSMREIGNEEGYQLSQNVEFIELEPNEFVHIPKISRLLDVDVFIGSNNCFIPFLKLYKEFKGYDIKTVMWNHEHYLLPYFDSNLKDALVYRKEVYKNVDVVLWLTSTSAYLSSFFAQKVAVIGNSVTQKVRRSVSNNNNSNAIISVGRFDSYQKRIDRLVMVYSEVIKKRSDIYLTIVGPYNLDMIVGEKKDITLRSLIKKLKIPAEKITFTDQVKDVSKYYSSSKVNVMTSEREGFGLTILEAAHYGVPSVVFRGGGSGDIIENGVNGYVVEEGNISEMADKILILFENQKLYQQISKEVLKLAKKYSVENMTIKWNNLLHSLLNFSGVELEKKLQKDLFNEHTVSSDKFAEIIKSYEESVDLYVQKSILTQNLLEELEIQRNIIYRIENSKSWKITKPIRIITKGLSLIQKQGLIPTIKIFLTKIKYKISYR